MLRYQEKHSLADTAIDEMLYLDGLGCCLEIDGVPILEGVVADAQGSLYEALYETARKLLDERRLEDASEL